MTKTLSKKILTVSLAALFGIAMIVSPIGAEAMGSFLDVKKAKITTDSTEFEQAKIETKAHIETIDAYGYGIISGAGLEAIAVTTTHGGVLDSEAQTDASDASFHNHYVALQNSGIGTGLCTGLEVRDITFEQPGDVEIKNKKAIMEDVPYYFAGTHSLSGDNISFLADGNVGAVVSFTIEPIFITVDEVETIGAVCINDVLPTTDLKVKESKH
jgi:hypothetical protein